MRSPKLGEVLADAGQLAPATRRRRPRARRRRRRRARRGRRGRGRRAAGTTPIGGVGAGGVAVEPAADPLEHARVLAEAGPEELAVVALAEPVHAVDRAGATPRRCARPCSASGRSSRPCCSRRTAASRTGRGAARRARRRRRRSSPSPWWRRRARRAASRVRLEHQRHGGGAPAAEEERRDRHALRVLPLGRDRRALRRRARRSASSGARPGVVGLGRPRLALPVGEVRGRLVGEVLPPHVAVVGERGVGEHGVARRACGARSGWTCSLVPGATPKNPNSGLIACRRPSSPNFIHAMSSPMVSTFQPGMVGISMARLVLPHADGNAAAM